MLARAAILIALAAPWCAAEWIRVSSPGVEVVTDAGEKTGRRLLARFEQIRDAFVQTHLLGAGAPARRWPIRALAFASEDEFDKYRPSPGLQGFYSKGSERDYIALYAGINVARVAFHEYVHLILGHSAIKLPTWFEEGTAEFYSTLQIDGAQVRVGAPIESHVLTLSRFIPMPARDLAGVTTESPEYRERELAGMFYAESWALVHMLNLSPGWRAGLPRFVELLGEDRPPVQAFPEAFGRSMEQALAELPVYLRSMRTATVKTSIEAALAPQVEKLNTVDAALERAGLALNLHRNALARSLLEKVPESAESMAGRADMALADGNAAEARRDFERASELGSRDASMYFEYAMLERDAGAAPQRVRSLVEKAIAVNPDFPDARFLTGVEDTDNGNYAAAVEHLLRAVAVRPRRADYWHALAYAQWKLGKREDALASGRRSLSMAETFAQTQSAAALVSMIEDPARTSSPPPRVTSPRITSPRVTSPRVKGPDVITPPSWESKKGDARVEGVLTRVDCEGAFARLHVMEGERTITVDVHHPGEVELVNAPEAGFTFSCGAQQMRVAIDYIAADHEVTRIEFRR